MTARVLFLDHVGELGGAELGLLDIAAAYRHTSHVILMDDGPFRTALEARGVTVSVTPGGALHRVRRATKFPGPASLLAGWEVARQIAKASADYDMLFANSQKAFIVACAAGWMSGKPILWDLNDLFGDDQFSRTNIRVAIALGNQCAVRVMTNSHASARAFVRHGGDQRKVYVVYNGIDASRFSSVEADAGLRIRRELKLENVPLVGVFGRLAEWKGQHVLIDALASLPGVHAAIVGDALFGEQDYVAGLHARAAERGVKDRVHFLGFRSDIPSVMHAMDIIVHTSVAPEPFGRVIVEGMLTRKPVIATREGGAVEILADGASGLLVTPGDATALATAIRRLFAHPATMASLGEAARARAIEHFSLDTMLANATEQIEAVAKR